jgi:hypothetical protein
MPITLTKVNIDFTICHLKLDVAKAVIHANAIENRKIAKLSCSGAGDPFSNKSNSSSLTSYKLTEPTLPRLTGIDFSLLGREGCSTIL